MAQDDDAAKNAADDAQKGNEPKRLDTDEEIQALLKDPEKALEVFRKMRDEKRDATAEAKKFRQKQEASDKAKQKADEEAMKEQGKWKELAEQEKTGRANDRSAFMKRLTDLHLQREAEAAGAIDADAVVALVNRVDIKVGDDFAVEGAKEAVEALKTSKAHLFAEKTAPVPPPKSGVPAPRGGFNTASDVDKLSPRELMERGLNKKK